MQRLRGLLIISAVCENEIKVHVGVPIRQEGALEMRKGSGSARHHQDIYLVIDKNWSHTICDDQKLGGHSVDKTFY